MNKLENAAIKYQIDFEKYKNGQANEVIDLLDKACREISVYLKKTTGVYTKARYQELVKKIKSISKSLKENIDSNIAIDDVINYELKKEKKLLKVAESYIKKGDSSKIDFLYPALEQIKTAALFKPIDTKYGMTYQSYLDGIENGLYNVWDSAIRTGYLTGQTTQQIVHSVLGGVSAKSRLVTQGAINSFRNSVYSNTRTVLQSFANETRNRVYEENEKYFGSKDDYKYEYLSTLDSRTCLVCGELSGKLFKSVKEFPQIPLHRGCRCLIIPYFNIDNDTKASKNGYVDSNVTFEKWLDEQDEKTQQEVLGKTRYNLYKNGEKIKDFVDDGKTLTLAQLTERGVFDISGGILDKSHAEQERFANDYYQEISNRKTKSDIAKISKNTGFPDEKVRAVRKHIFEDKEHLLSDGSKVKFCADARIALAWQRLEQNKATETDIMLLNHEYTELSFMAKKGYNYEKSHWLADLRYPWEFKVYEKWRLLNDVEIHEIVRKQLKNYL